MAKAKNNHDWYKIDRFSPEQLMQVQRSVQDYAAAFDGLPKNHSEVFEKRGWLLPFLFSYDDLLWGRWNYWHEILQKKTISGSSPIPRITWSDRGHGGVEAAQNMLRKCLNHHESTIDLFADWLLWGLAAAETVPRVSPVLNEHYYRMFDIFLVQNYPTDYLSLSLSEETGKGYKSGLGYFPTPMQVCILMTEMISSTEDPEDLKRKSIMEPSVGCGAMLLPASNYHLRGFAMDISQIAVKLCKIQMYWFAPWFAFHPEWLQGFDKAAPVQIVPAQPGRGIVEGQMMFDLVGV